MKEKGITFQHVTEAEAADFLANNTYYMKLAAYRANYMGYAPALFCAANVSGY